MDNSKVVHRFFRVRASARDDNNDLVRGTGHVCLALVPVRGNPKKYRVAASFKSPADSSDRDLGMAIADGRLISRKAGRNFFITAASVETAVKVATSALFERKRTLRRRGRKVSRPFAPDWLVDAVVAKEHVLTAIKR